MPEFYWYIRKTRSFNVMLVNVAYEQSNRDHVRLCRWPVGRLKKLEAIIGTTGNVTTQWIENVKIKKKENRDQYIYENNVLFCYRLFFYIQYCLDIQAPYHPVNLKIPQWGIYLHNSLNSLYKLQTYIYQTCCTNTLSVYFTIK